MRISAIGQSASNVQSVQNQAQNPPPSQSSAQTFQTVVNNATAGGKPTTPPPTVYSPQTQHDITAAQTTGQQVTAAATSYGNGVAVRNSAVTALVQHEHAQWQTVQADIAKQLKPVFTAKYHQLGDGQLAPDQVVQPIVNTVSNQPVDDKSILGQVTSAAVKTASTQGYQQAYSDWHAQQITSSDIRKLHDNVTHAESLTGPDAQQAWNTVESQITTIQEGGFMLGNQPQGKTAQGTAVSLVNQLNKSFNNDSQFVAHDNAVYNGTTVKDLTTLNLTDKQLKPVTDATAAYQKYLNDHNIDPSSQAATTGGAAASYNAVKTAIEHQIEGAQTNMKDFNPAVRARDLNNTATSLLNMGPATGSNAGLLSGSDIAPANGYQQAVVDGNFYVRVTIPSQQVAQAYNSASDHGTGAKNAAATLNDVTTFAGDPSYAAMILNASSPTLKQIGTQLGKYLQDVREYVGSPSRANAQNIYDNLSQAFEQTNSVTTTNADVIATVSAAHALVSGLPNDGGNGGNTLADRGIFPLLSNVAQSSIGQGNGTALTLAIADDLKFNRASTNGSTDSQLVLAGYQRGIDDLNTKTTNDVQALAETTSTISTLISTWAPYMTPQQLNDAIKGYMTPDFTAKYQSQLNAVLHDGTAIGQAHAGMENFGAGFDTMTQNAPNKLIASDAGRIALSSSGWAAQQILETGLKFGPGGSSPTQYANSAISLPTFLSLGKNVKGAVKTSEFQGTQPTSFADLYKRITGRAMGETADNNFLKGLAGAGVGFYALSATQQPLGSEKQWYNNLGGIKEAAELILRNFRSNSTIINNMFQGIKNPNVPSLLWNTLGAAYSTWGVVIDVKNLRDTNPNDTWSVASNGSALAADLAGALTSGSFVLSNAAKLTADTNLAKTLGAAGALDELGDGAIAAYGALGPWAVGLTVVAIAASLGKSAFDHYEDQTALTAASQKFLQDGFHLGANSAVVKGLASGVPEIDNTTASITAYAKATGVTPADIVNFLNRQKPDKVATFLEAAKTMAQGGFYQTKTSDHDGQGAYYYHPVSVRGLEDTANSLFGRGKMPGSGNTIS